MSPENATDYQKDVESVVDDLINDTSISAASDYTSANDSHDEVQIVKEVIVTQRTDGPAENKSHGNNSESSNELTFYTADTHPEKWNIEDIEAALSALKITDNDAATVDKSLKMDSGNNAVIASKIDADKDVVDVIEVAENDCDDDDDDSAALQNRINEVLSYFNKNNAKENEQEDENLQDGDDLTQKFYSNFRIPFEKEQTEKYAASEFSNEKVLSLLTENSTNMSLEQLKLLEEFRVCCICREYTKDILAAKVLHKIRAIQDQRERNLQELEKQFQERMVKLNSQFENTKFELMDKFYDNESSGDDIDD
uniref:Uncharacterized protein n=1 Tax=Panagrolaimus superbus TaxID=310955 RepID=A0A914Z684_9BILA